MSSPRNLGREFGEFDECEELWNLGNSENVGNFGFGAGGGGTAEGRRVRGQLDDLMSSSWTSATKKRQALTVDVRDGDPHARANPPISKWI